MLALIRSIYYLYVVLGLVVMTGCFFTIVAILPGLLSPLLIGALLAIFTAVTLCSIGLFILAFAFIANILIIITLQVLALILWCIAFLTAVFGIVSIGPPALVLEKVPVLEHAISSAIVYVAAKINALK